MHNRIALFRAEQGISRRDLARAVGVNNQTIGYLERGDYKPSLELALKIARHFGVNVETIFSLTPFGPIAAALEREKGDSHELSRTDEPATDGSPGDRGRTLALSSA